MFLLPLSHDRMTVQRLPWVTIVILAVNVVAFMITWPMAQRDDVRTAEARDALVDYASLHPGIWEDDCVRCPGREQFDALKATFDQARNEHIFSRFGYVPSRPTLTGLLGSLFLHAGWMHLFGNMYFLWLYGCSVEDLWGRPLYAAVYLSGGAAAAAAHGHFEPESIGLVGASGAIAALTGVFFVRCYDTRIRFFYMFLLFFGTFYAPAWIMLLLWFTRELFNAFVFSDTSPVAFWAHIGGFVYGAAIAVVMKLTRFEEAVIAPSIDRKTNLMSLHPRMTSAFQHIDRGDYASALDDLNVVVRERRDDPDAYRVMAQCYQALGRTVDAGRALRQELAIQIRRRDHELTVETFQELMSTAPDTPLTHRELYGVATAALSVHEDGIAANLLRELVDAADDPTIRLRAGVTLSDYYAREKRTKLALETLDRIAGLADGQPDWAQRIESQRAKLQT